PGCPGLIWGSDAYNPAGPATVGKESFDCISQVALRNMCPKLAGELDPAFDLRRCMERSSLGDPDKSRDIGTQRNTFGDALIGPLEVDAWRPVVVHVYACLLAAGIL